MTDYTVGDTIHFMFTTRQFATGAPFTLAGTPVISAYENEGLTQITAGITLGVDHDSVTGLNLITVVASGANGFEAGKDYHLVITTGTVDSVSVVGEVVGRFTLERSAVSGASVSAIADGILDRDMATGTDSGSTTVRTVRQALRFLRNKWAVAAGTLTVYKEDDATASWTASVTGDATADPITGSDPAGP
jgi:hypothetical protein